ncbi:hypothetical protein D3273_25190 [Lichenibacterium minor]|uniref:Uncharacterized protein n=1 Tax=Lichenibacterium minor TaxID=2316528 RepID=A0A4Q2U3A4_9HYPH|nr:hypothetical protein [Lichenibacterium minor]RYC29216.1 hypothetical protein D3273_25190 [Lichenibacterium minor]
MAERALISLDDLDMAVRDVHDVLLVVGLALNADGTDLTAGSRDTLATVVRLGIDRAKVAHMGLDDLKETRR